MVSKFFAIGAVVIDSLAKGEFLHSEPNCGFTYLRYKGNAALGGVAQYFGSLSLTSKSMKGADCNEDEGVAA